MQVNADPLRKWEVVITGKKGRKNRVTISASELSQIPVDMHCDVVQEIPDIVVVRDVCDKN